MSIGTLVNEEKTAAANQSQDARFVVSGGPATDENGQSAEWFRELRADAWHDFELRPAPKRTDEEWRFASIKKIDLSPYREPLPVSEDDQAELLARSEGLKEIAGRMVFANDQLLGHEVLSEELKKQGVIWAPIEKAAVEHEEIFRKHFMAQGASLGSEKYAALHKALTRTGTFLYVPKNVEIALPLEVTHWLHGENGSVFPHTLIIAGENSKLTLVDYFESSDSEAPGFACGVNDLYLEAGAQLNYVCVQNWSKKTLAFQMNSTVVGRDASAKSLNVNLGSAYARSESVSSLVGEGSRSDMLAANIANGEQEFDQRTYQEHRVPNTSSDLLYKNSLDGKARTIFAGLIRVDPGAHKTDAYQKVANLLLSDEAEANSMPGLEIKADDVRCTHGATSGQVDNEELFYLLARGIDKKTAQKLIVYGFLNEVITRFGNKAIEEKLSDLIHAQFLR